MNNLKKRSCKPELMDEENISFAELNDCLYKLEKINIATLAYRPVLRWLKPYINHNKNPLALLDVGCGRGDMLRRIENFATGKKKPVRLTGIDINPLARRAAEMAAPGSLILYETADIFTYRAADRKDLIISSLFTHHLSDEQLLRFLRWIDESAVKGWFINDLHRHALPYYFIKAATALLSRNRLIRHDAPLSVARSFRSSEWRSYLEASGIRGAKIQWHFPFRLCVSCRKM